MKINGININLFISKKVFKDYLNKRFGEILGGIWDENDALYDMGQLSMIDEIKEFIDSLDDIE